MLRQESLCKMQRVVLPTRRGHVVVCLRMNRANDHDHTYTTILQVCSWQLSLPRGVQREVMWCALGLKDYSLEPAEQQPLRVAADGLLSRPLRLLVVDRRDAKSRWVPQEASFLNVHSLPGRHCIPQIPKKSCTAHEGTS